MKSLVITYGFIAAMMFSLASTNVLNDNTKNSAGSQAVSQPVSYYITADDMSLDFSCFDKKIKKVANLVCPHSTSLYQPIQSNYFYPEHVYALSDNSRRTLARFSSLLKI